MANREDNLYPIGHPKCLIKPGRKKGSKNKTGWRGLEDGIVDLLGISLDVFSNAEDKSKFRKKMREAAQRNPVGYIVKVVVPILRALPQDIKIMVLNKYINVEADGDNMDAIAIISALIEGKSKEELDQLESSLRHIEDGESK